MSLIDGMRGKLYFWNDMIDRVCSTYPLETEITELEIENRQYNERMFELQLHRLGLKVLKKTRNKTLTAYDVHISIDEFKAIKCFLKQHLERYIYNPRTDYPLTFSNWLKHKDAEWKQK